MDPTQNLKELASYEPIMKQYAEKTAQAIEIRAKLVAEKISAWELSKNSQTMEFAKREEAMFRLRRCLKNEKKFIAIIDANIEGHLSALRRVKGTLKHLEAGKEVIEHAQFLLDILGHSLDHLEAVKKRITKEDKILSMKQEHFNYDEEFIELWKREITFDKQLLKMINPNKLQRLKEFGDKLGMLAKKLPVEGLAVGGSVGAVAFLMSAPYWKAMASHPEGSRNLLLAVGALAGIFAAGHYVVYVLQEYENVMFQKQEEKLRNLKGYGIFAFLH